MNSFLALIALSAIYVVADKFDDSAFRIVDGEYVPIESAPYQALVTMRLPTSTSRCGGAIIGQSVILTAAHCLLAAKKVAEIKVQTGSSNFYKGSLHDVDSYMIHEGYNDSNNDNDIALVKLKGKITDGTVIPLATVDPVPGEKGVLTGWGTTSGNGWTGSDELKVAKLAVMSRDKCKKWFPKTYVITDRQMCAGPVQGNGCKGDSGGPLVVRNKLEGVLSWGGFKCDAPLVFSSVAYNRNWIKQKTGI